MIMSDKFLRLYTLHSFIVRNVPENFRHSEKYNVEMLKT